MECDVSSGGKVYTEKAPQEKKIPSWCYFVNNIMMCVNKTLQDMQIVHTTIINHNIMYQLSKHDNEE